MRSPTAVRVRRGVLLVAVGLATVPSGSALAAGVTKSQAQRVAKRAASARVARFGISYPPGAWRAGCSRGRGASWRCAVGTGGQCSGEVTVSGTRSHPRTRRVRVFCFE